MQKVSAFLSEVTLTGLAAVASILTPILILVLALAVFWHAQPPGPTPEPVPDAAHPIIAPKELNAPVEEETPLAVKALGPVKFVNTANVMVRQAGMTGYVMPLVEGEHKLLVTMDAGGWWWNRYDAAFVWVKIKTAKPPPPVPPVPPDPPVPPVPPTPPSPIPLPGFRVVIVYDPATLTNEQDGIVRGERVRKYLLDKCVAGEDGKTKAFWIIQTNPDLSNAPKWLADCVQKHTTKPFMVVSDGKTGYDGDIPANADAAMAILTKIGG